MLNPAPSAGFNPVDWPLTTPTAAALPNVFGFDDPNIMDIFQYSFGDASRSLDQWLTGGVDPVPTTTDQRGHNQYLTGDFSWCVQPIGLTCYRC
jgi:hypothetical protein